MISSYADSLFSLAKEENILNDIYDGFMLIDELYKNKEISEFFGNRFVEKEKKAELINNYFQDIHPYFKNFLLILSDDNNLDYLFEIRDLFLDSYYKEMGIVKGYVYGISLAKSDLEKLEEVFSKKLNKTVSLEFIRDESLLGGYKVEVDNKLYDNSYKRRLLTYKDKLKKEA